jgi:hypothetical protein
MYFNLIIEKRAKEGEREREREREKKMINK